MPSHAPLTDAACRRARRICEAVFDARDWDPEDLPTAPHELLQGLREAYQRCTTREKPQQRADPLPRDMHIFCNRILGGGHGWRYSGLNKAAKRAGANMRPGLMFVARAEMAWLGVHRCPMTGISVTHKDTAKDGNQLVATAIVVSSHTAAASEGSLDATVHRDSWPCERGFWYGGMGPKRDGKTQDYNATNQALFRSSFAADNGGGPLLVFCKLSEKPKEFRYIGRWRVVAVAVDGFGRWRFTLRRDGPVKIYPDPGGHAPLQCEVGIWGGEKRKFIRYVDCAWWPTLTDLRREIAVLPEVSAAYGANVRVSLRFPSPEPAVQGGDVRLVLCKENPFEALQYLEIPGVWIEVAKGRTPAAVLADISDGAESFPVRAENHPGVLTALDRFGYTTHLHATHKLGLSAGLRVLQPQPGQVRLRLTWCGKEKGVGVVAAQDAPAGSYLGAMTGQLTLGGRGNFMGALLMNDGRASYTVELFGHGLPPGGMSVEPGLWGSVLRFCNHDSGQPNAHLIALRYQREQQDPTQVRGHQITVQPSDFEREPSECRMRAWQWLQPDGTQAAEERAASAGPGVLMHSCLYLLRDVKEGEEIVWDYGAQYWEDMGITPLQSEPAAPPAPAAAGGGQPAAAEAPQAEAPAAAPAERPRKKRRRRSPG
eukprot:TRINITY_DN18003_c2_g1_i1.p1 TRINITY_DN18003_c2_g1~~TRINITY_DN18003_c2_g1_i1.p1  ORF type:complete len:691 (+),score=166.84 TRINITY_DN18003_c2_g1_i1:110-2074(+)